MSSVYRAERADGRFDQVVALKVMAAWLADPEFLRRFDTERQLLAALNHHNITPPAIRSSLPSSFKENPSIVIATGAS